MTYFPVLGTWDDQVEVSPVISDMGTPSNPVYKTGSPVRAWKRNPVDPEAENYYNLSVFACQLNEMEEGIAPTDSRLRPDQRLMELGKWDEANEEKLRLEEKQRAVRRQREAETEKAVQEGGLEISSLKDSIVFRSLFVCTSL